MDLDKLLNLARSALPGAYAPYSGYPVAAALLTDGGDVFTGVNVENASLGLTICAERAAVAAAVAGGQRQFSHIAVVAGGESLPIPCGACRQVLAEFAPALPVIVSSRNEDVRAYTLAELLPHSFSLPEKSG
ncbi:MAG TPA: cytidine deaminase [Firmicutes bacterium]|nr:cytidine deaminase [Bacillota bacterium]